MPKKSVEKQLARRLAIIQALPCLSRNGGGDGITIGHLVARLGGEYPVDRRTFERDLQELSDPDGDWRQLGLEVISRPGRANARIKEWFTTVDSKIPIFKSVTPADALVASFASQELGPLLPREARQSLEEQVSLVERKLRHLQLTSKHQQGLVYKDKVRRMPDANPMMASRVDPAHLQTVNDALMENLMLQLSYRAAKVMEYKDYRVAPVGLVIHDRSLRLVAIEEGELGREPSAMTVKSFLLHRLQEAAVAGPVPRHAKVPTLDQATDKGIMKMWSQGEIGLHVRFAENESALVFARTLEEMPLSHDQKIHRNSDGWLELKATVSNTSALRRMLQSMAREIKIIAPEALQREICEFLADGLAFQQMD